MFVGKPRSWSPVTPAGGLAALSASAVAFWTGHFRDALKLNLLSLTLFVWVQYPDQKRRR